MLDPRYAFVAQRVSLLLLAVIGGAISALVALVGLIGSMSIPGAPGFDQSWYRVGLFAPGNESGRVDQTALTALKRVRGVGDIVYWSTHQVQARTGDDQMVSLTVAFVSSGYLESAEIGFEDGELTRTIADSEILLTQSGWRRLALESSTRNVPLVEIGTRVFRVAPPLSRTFVGPGVTEPVDAIMSAENLRTLVFGDYSSIAFGELPVFSVLVNASQAHAANDLQQALGASSAQSDSQFLATSTRRSWSVFQSFASSPEEAYSLSLFRIVQLSACVLIFVATLLVFVIADSLTREELIHSASIRRALGQQEEGVVWWIARRSLLQVPLLALLVGLIGWAFFTYWQQSLSIGAIATNEAGALGSLSIAALVVATLPALASITFSVVVANGVSLADGVREGSAKVLYVHISVSFIFLLSIALTLATAAAFSFSSAVTGLAKTNLGFLPQSLMEMSIHRPLGSIPNTSAGIIESRLIEEYSANRSIDIGVTSCPPVHSVDRISNFDIEGGVAAGLICHATPGALRALGAHLVSGRYFEVDEADGAVVTEAFLRTADPTATIGSPILGAALGKPARVTGIIREININGVLGAPPPVAFLNGASFGAQGTLLHRDSHVSLDAFQRDLGLEFELGDTREVATEIENRHAHFFQQRTLALASSGATAALCGLGLILCFLLELGTCRREIGVRMSLGATMGDLALWLIRRVGTPAFSGLLAGCLATPVIVLSLDRVFPLEIGGVLSSILLALAILIVVLGAAGYLALRLFVSNFSAYQLIRS